MVINHNMSAINALRAQKNTNINTMKDMSKLASGLRITTAADDASGLSVSEKMRSQIRGLNQASSNASDGISLIQLAEGYLGGTTEALQRVRELAIQSSNGIYSGEDRMQIQVEVSQLIDEIDRVASHAQFNGMHLLTGRFSQANGVDIPTSSMWFHVGSNIDERIQMFIGTMTATALGLRDLSTGITLSLSTQEQANRNIGILDDVLKKVNTQRSTLGAYQGRLELAVKGLDTSAENMQAAESRIRDLDMAAQMVNYSKNQILSQSSLAMLAQANMRSQNVLQLLQ